MNDICEYIIVDRNFYNTIYYISVLEFNFFTHLESIFLASNSRLKLSSQRVSVNFSYTSCQIFLKIVIQKKGIPHFIAYSLKCIKWTIKSKTTVEIKKLFELYYMPREVSPFRFQCHPPAKHLLPHFPGRIPRPQDLRPAKRHHCKNHKCK